MSEENPSGAEARESFAAMFEQSYKGKVRQSSVRAGEMLEGVVVHITRDTVFVELDGKRQAYMDLAEARSGSAGGDIQVGQTLRARVMEVESQNGNVRLGTTAGRPHDARGLELALEAGASVDGKVTKVNKGGLEVEIAGVRAFCPVSQIDNKFVQDPASFVGKSLSFLVTEIREGGKNVLLSRRALLERDAKEQEDRAMRALAVGAKVRGTITSIQSFGAFVDLGGIEGMIPASQISYDRNVNVADALNVGDVVEAEVLEIKTVPDKRRSDVTHNKVTLSLKSRMDDPWASVESTVHQGQVAQGSVTRVVDFGAFVRLAPGIEGLLPRAELGGRADALLGSMKPGSQVTVVIQSIDQERRKISLAPAPEGLSVGASVSQSAVTVGAVVSGTVDRIENYGLFLQIDGTSGRSGRGLIPAGELGTPRGTDLRKAFPIGTKLTAKVLEIGDGRIRLSVRGAKDDQERTEFESHRDKGGSGSGKMGTFADLLRARGKK